MLSTRSWPIMGACWWWSISPPPSGVLAVAVAQDMGITVGYLPGLSMRRIADLTPGSAKTDAKDAAVIAGAARSMPHTLRAINASDEDAAALSMLTGFDLDLARQVNQTEGRIRGQSFTQTPPSPRDRGGALAGRTTPSWRPVAAWPTPAELKRAGKARIDARLKKHGCRRHATWAGQIVSALELQSVTVAGTNAAAVVLPHLARQLIAPRAQRADVAAQAGGPGGWPTLMCQVLTTPARDQGSRPPPSLLAQTLDKDLQAPEPSWPPTPGSLPSHAAPAHRSVVSTSPTAATRGSSAPCSCPPSPHCAPTPSPGPTTSANATKANRLGPGRPRPGPPPLDTPHRGTPQRGPQGCRRPGRSVLRPCAYRSTSQSNLPGPALKQGAVDDQLGRGVQVLHRRHAAFQTGGDLGRVGARRGRRRSARRRRPPPASISRGGLCLR